ncbi:Oidioi.mRNA.OKI2018_I69.chr1.g216.t1.cds [Oikopleura dioica]|uniref:Oidioi.mRNA.OKI2018_I69.chr1.g216.t1.cds n=1 Tax=Oikopleura dioica TaxID=34765 RepID=A0ABN7SQE8_OIKDI|nr:Oidioi.mRNA.OKI2018_I69.chr1.g216.t1.cds [Oikopleura dioica]
MERQSVIIRNPNYPEKERKRPEPVQRSSVICQRPDPVTRVSPYEIPGNFKQKHAEPRMDNDELRDIYLTLPQQKLFKGMLNFASNISDGEDVQFINSSIPTTSKSPVMHRPTASPIRRPPITSASIAGPPMQHPRLPVPNIEKPTKKKGPVPKLYDGECCKICGDKASGFHYNVVSCEGCKGFYRRAILETRAFRCKGTKVGECMKDYFLSRKCKYCRFDACQKGGMAKHYLQNKNTNGKYPALNPGEEELLKMVINFWGLYRDGVSAAMDKKPPEMPKTMRPIKKTNPFVVIQKKLREISINVPEYPEEDSIAAMRSRMGHLIALSQLHLQFILLLVEAMPFYNDLTEATRKLITKESIVEIIFLRAACCAGGNGVASVNGARYSAESLQKSGVSSSCISILSDFIKWVRKLQLLEEEFAIIVVLILMSPDRGVAKDVDRCQLYRVQEIFRDILRQFVVDKFPETATKRIAKIVDLLMKLRMISGNLNKQFHSAAKG